MVTYAPIDVISDLQWSREEAVRVLTHLGPDLAVREWSARTGLDPRTVRAILDEVAGYQPLRRLHALEVEVLIDLAAQPRTLEDLRGWIGTSAADPVRELARMNLIHPVGPRAVWTLTRSGARTLRHYTLQED